MVEPCSCDRDSMVHKAKNIYYLALSKSVELQTEHLSPPVLHFCYDRFHLKHFKSLDDM